MKEAPAIVCPMKARRDSMFGPPIFSTSVVFGQAQEESERLPHLLLAKARIIAECLGLWSLFIGDQQLSQVGSGFCRQLAVEQLISQCIDNGPGVRQLLGDYLAQIQM